MPLYFMVGKSLSCFHLRSPGDISTNYHVISSFKGQKQMGNWGLIALQNGLFCSVYFCQLRLGNIFQEMRQRCYLGASLASIGLHRLFVSALRIPSGASYSALPRLPNLPLLSSLTNSSQSCMKKMQFCKVWEKGCSHAGVENKVWDQS